MPVVPLEYAVGDTQGAIGFMFQNALYNELQRRGISDTPVSALVTQTLIDPTDPAFNAPDKPIGAHMDRDVGGKTGRQPRVENRRRCRARLAARGGLAQAAANH